MASRMIIRSFQTIGELLLPDPGNFTFHLIFSVSDQWMGGFAVSEVPLKVGPRKFNQFSWSDGWAVAEIPINEKRQKAAQKPAFR